MSVSTTDLVVRGAECGPGGECRDGRCLCNDVSGGILCEGRCVATATDPSNCGECGYECSPDQPFCLEGRCSDCQSCDGNLDCTDLTSDPLNCGQCGNVCEQGAQCVLGECTSGTCDANCFEEAPVCCARAEGDVGCTNLRTDRLNCGLCGNECPGDTPCVGGRCGQ